MSLRAALAGAGRGTDPTRAELAYPAAGGPAGKSAWGAVLIADDATISVIDDEPEVRDSLARLLRSEGLAVETFESATDFLARAPIARIGCILLDVNMPGMTGPELHEVLKQRGIETPIIYLTGRSTLSTGVRAMKQGARDFLEKPVDADTLLPAIHDAVRAHRASSERREAIESIRKRLASLSAREREVLEHVVRGRLNKQIAADLGIAEKTVKVHRGRAMAKMKVRSVAELVHLYERMPANEAGPNATT